MSTSPPPATVITSPPNVRFRAVCASWRSATDSPRGRSVTDPRFHPRRWMMLPEGHGLRPGHPNLRGYARFLHLDTGTFVRARVPLLADHCIIDSVDGLLLLMRDPDQDNEGAAPVRLVHPSPATSSSSHRYQLLFVVTYN
uniref:Uncharacterized protein n=1 Tax=Leersia perrieri TaxID=77586 RepID=A0A0D9W6E9_9ORYZ